MEHICKKCLLLEAGEKASFEGVKSYLETVDDSLKVSREVYEKRLEYCKKCDSLIAGMCIKCGCYCELRAALKNKSCADYDNKRWEKEI